jgi:hypothetical protein
MSMDFTPGTDWEHGVNMHNRGAARVLEALGYDPDPIAMEGLTADATDFLGRVLLAEALEPHDQGRPGYDKPGPGARWHEAPVEDGDLQRRLGQVREVAELAIRRGEPVYVS